MYLAKPSTASLSALKRLGTIGLSTSAITAMWISLAVIPTSVALGFSLLDCAPAGMGVAASVLTDTTKTATSATQRARFIVPPWKDATGPVNLTGRRGSV